MMMRPWLFRVASSTVDGGGHVSRCSVLAKALIDLNISPFFCLDSDVSHYKPFLVDQGFEVLSRSSAEEMNYDVSFLDGYRFSENELL